MRGLPRVVWVLGLASLLNDVSSEAIFPLLPLFLASLGAPMRFIGLIEGSADALASILKVVAGRLSDRGPRRLLVAGGYALPALARAGIAAAMAPWHVLAARLSTARARGFAPGPRDAMIADSVAPSQRGRAFGLNRSMDHFGAAVGPLLASALLALGARPARRVPVAAVIGLMAPIVLFFRLRDQPRRGADRSGPIDAAARGGRCGAAIRSYLVACVLFALGNSSDAFLLVRAREVGWSAHGAAAAVGVPPPGEVAGGGSGRRAVRPPFARHGGVVRLGGLRAHLRRVRLRDRSAGRSWCCSSSTPSITAWPRGRSARSSPISSDRGARGRAYGLYHGLVGVAALPAGIGDRLDLGSTGARRWALGVNAAFARVASALPAGAGVRRAAARASRCRVQPRAARRNLGCAPRAVRRVVRVQTARSRCSSSCSRRMRSSSRSTICSVATTGTATTAPMMPAISPKNRIDSVDDQRVDV